MPSKIVLGEGTYRKVRYCRSACASTVRSKPPASSALISEANQNRLPSPSHINDAQSAHSQADRIFDIPPLIVRPTMDQASDHPGQAFVVPKSSKPADPAHDRQASLTRTTQSSRHRHRVVPRETLHAVTSMVGAQAN